MSAIVMARVSGSKTGLKGSSSGSGNHEDPNSLRSNVRARIVDLVSEGPIEGFVSDNPLKDVFFDRTPVMNPDGSLNFKGVTFDYRLGLPDQAEIKGFSIVEAPYPVQARVYFNQGPVVRTISDKDATAVKVTITLPQLNAVNKTEKYAGIYKTTVQYAFDVKAATGPWVEAVNVTITDKCTSPYQRMHRLDLPAGGYPWQVRMRRITADSTSDDFQNQTYWDSYVEVVEARLTYMHSAVMAIEVDASQFGSNIPNRSYRLRLRKWPVPSNYDPVARTYTGLWDGTWVEKWTNNPAFVFRGLVLQSRFGLGEFIDKSKFDDAGIYQIAQYCDQKLDDGYGNLAPRYTFNGVLNTFQEAHRALQDIAATFRGMSFWSLGQIFATADMPKDPILLVTKANTIGGFEYSSTAIKARHTAAAVSWNDPADFYRSAVELVRDAEGVRRFGWRQDDTQLVGCTNRAQAYRMGLWKIDTELNEFETVTYRASFDHAALAHGETVTGLLPGDIIQIADPRKMNVRAGGRVAAVTSTTKVQLDAPFVMTAGQSYRLRVTRPNGKIAEAAIASIDAGNVATLSAALPELPLVEAVYLIVGSDAAPRQFRVLEVAEESKNVFRITALFYDPNKFARIEQGIKLPSISYTRPKTTIAAPTNLGARETNFFRDNVPFSRLTLSWTPGADFMTAAYQVTANTPTGFVNYGEIGAPVIDIEAVQPGDYTFTVIARSNTPGVFSAPVDLTVTVKGWAGAAGPSITGLQVLGGGSTFTGGGADLVWGVSWPAGAATYEVDYIVRIFDAGTGNLVRTVSVPGAAYTYSFEANGNDARAAGLTGPRRSFRVQVSARDLMGRESAPVALVVSNPPPSAIAPTLTATAESLFVTMPRVSDPDFAGYLVWYSTTSGFVPTDANVAADLSSSTAILKANPDTTYYVRVAAYDAFSKAIAGLNLSAEYSVKSGVSQFDTAPAVPGQPTLSSVSETAPDGTVSARVTVTWPAVTSSNLARYEVSYAEGATTADTAFVGGRTTSGTSLTIPGLMPGRVYSVRVRSVSTLGSLSGWSPIANVTAAANLTAPDNPTGASVSVSINTAFLTWTSAAQKDIAKVEVWAFTGASAAASPPGGSVLVDTAAYPATRSQDALPIGGTKTYWLRSINSSGTPSAAYVLVGSATSTALVAAQLGAGIVTATNLASTITAPMVVSSLPTTKVAPYVTLTTDGKLYRWDATLNSGAGAYTAAVPTVDLIGQVVTSQIADGAVLASKLVLADPSNMVLNGDFLGGSTGGWTLLGDTGLSQSSASDAGGYYRLQAATAYIAAGSNYVQVTPGDTIYVSCMAYNTRASGGAGILVEFTDQTGGNYSNAFYYTFTKNAWARVEGKVQVPPNVQRVRMYCYADQPSGNTAPAYWGKFQMRRANNAMLIVDGTITAAQLNVGNIFADSAVLNKISTGVLVAGAVKTDMLDAGVITAAKLAIGLTSGNMIFNADLAAGFSTWSVAGPWGVAPNGAGAGLPYAGCSGAANSYNAISPLVLNPDGSIAGLPIVPGLRYEASVYCARNGGAQDIEFAWSDSAGNYISSPLGTSVDTTDVFVSGTRLYGFAVAPANAARVTLRFRFLPGSVAAFGWFARPYFGIALPNQVKPSVWGLGSGTIIDGSTIWTNSLNANKIMAGTITTDKFTAGTIDANILSVTTLRSQVVATGLLTADNIVVGNGSLTSVFAGTNSTTINGGALTANTVSAAKLSIASRPLNVWEITFQMERDGAGNPTQVLKWTGGGISWPDENGVVQFVYISAGQINTNGGETQVWWVKGQSTLTAQVTGVQTPLSDPNAVILASRSSGMGLMVLYGRTIVDGTTIQALSIQTAQLGAGSITADKIGAAQIVAGKLAADAVQAGNIAALAVSTRELQAGAVSAEKISVGLGMGNRIWNADFMTVANGLNAAVPGYAISYNPFNFSNVYVGQCTFANNFHPPGMGSLQINNPAAMYGDQAIDVRIPMVAGNGFSLFFPVIGGKRYELSGYIAAHRCDCSMILGWLDANGNYLGDVYSNIVSNNNADGPLQNWGRCLTLGYAPAGAVQAALTVRMVGNGQTNPFAFWTGLYFSEALAGQTSASPWSSAGATVIDGSGIRAQSITVDRLNVVSLSAITANLGIVTAGVLQSADGKFVIDLNNRRMLISD